MHAAFPMVIDPRIPSLMFSDDDIHYALETTRVIREPDRRIDTFGATAFEFFLVTELMDSIGQVRIREGRIEASKPQILRPDAFTEMSFEGFGDQAGAFADWMKREGIELDVIRYGFSFTKADIKESLVEDSFETVCDRLKDRIESGNNPLAAVIKGVDDTWEICLLKFTIEMIEKSRGTNVFDFKRKGLL